MNFIIILIKRMLFFNSLKSFFLKSHLFIIIFFISFFSLLFVSIHKSVLKKNQDIFLNHIPQVKIKNLTNIQYKELQQANETEYISELLYTFSLYKKNNIISSMMVYGFEDDFLKKKYSMDVKNLFYTSNPLYLKDSVRSTVLIKQCNFKKSMINFLLKDIRVSYKDIPFLDNESCLTYKSIFKKYFDHYEKIYILKTHFDSLDIKSINKFLKKHKISEVSLWNDEYKDCFFSLKIQTQVFNLIIILLFFMSLILLIGSFSLFFEKHRSLINILLFWNISKKHLFLFFFSTVTIIFHISFFLATIFSFFSLKLLTSLFFFMDQSYLINYTFDFRFFFYLYIGYALISILFSVVGYKKVNIRDLK